MKSRVGLALSGGGSRAAAFHLGCLRALQDHRVLEQIRVLSSVSGGSVIAALYAYFDEPFEDFDGRVVELLRKGLIWGIIRQTLFSPETLKIVATQATAGVTAAVGPLARLGAAGLSLAGLGGEHISSIVQRIQAPLPRIASRSTAFERHLRKSIFGERRVDEPTRGSLQVVLNAAELTTGTAFRFGSSETGAWRFGRLTGRAPFVSKAVAASACYPALLPSFDEVHEFEQNGEIAKRRVIITDGGIYDNLGITCLLPGRSDKFSTNVSDVDFIIACDAGQGMPSGMSRPYLWGSRMYSTLQTIHRRTHSLSYQLLHRMTEAGQLEGFLLPYLGQIDERLPYIPKDLVPRTETFNYPTNFSPMPETNLSRLALRGEQLTRLLIAQYGSHL